MSASAIRDEIRIFFDGFVAAFPSFDGEAVAQLFVTPYMAIRADGSAEIHATHDSVREFFQGVLNEYRRGGCAGCMYDELSVCELGDNAALGTVRWDLTGADGDVLSRWRESYHLVRVGTGWKIRVSTDHA